MSTSRPVRRLAGVAAGLAAGLATLAIGVTWAADATPAPSVALPAPDIAAPAAAATDAPPAAATPVGGEAADTAPALTEADVSAWMDGFMPYALQQGDIAGAVVVVVKDGQVLLQRGYGYSDVAAGTPMDAAKTLVRPGSVSKLFTWTAVMQLVEQGKINLDENIDTYLDFKVEGHGGAPITMRNLMTHTGGFEETTKNLIIVEADGVPKLEDVVKSWTPDRIFAPGKTPAYSNYATALAGYIVQRVSGEPFDEYVNTHIFQLLGMQHSSFTQPLPEPLLKGMSKGYPTASMPDKPYEIVGPAPAGSLATTASDMGQFMIAHLQDGRYDGTRILEPATAQQMHTTALTIVPHVNRMLLGFYETNRNGHRVIAHAGDTQWFHSDLHLFIDDNVGLFVSFNSPGKDGAAGPARNALFNEFANRYFPATGSAADKGAKVDPKVASEHARLVAGNYIVSRRVETKFLSLLSLAGGLKVIDNGDGTVGLSMMKSPSGVPFRWHEIEPFVWQKEHASDLLAAEVSNGRVVRVAFSDLSPFMVFDRTTWWQSDAWLMPAGIVALVVLLLTALAWPISALVRRYYRVPVALAPTDAKAQRRMRLVAVATVLAWLGWLGMIVAMMSNYSLMTARTDMLLLALQVIGAIVFVAGTLVGLWSARATLRGSRSKLSKAWAVLLALSLLVSLWIAVVFHLISVGVKY